MMRNGERMPSQPTHLNFLLTARYAPTTPVRVLRPSASSLDMMTMPTNTASRM